MTASNPFLTVPVDVLQAETDLLMYVSNLTRDLRNIEAALSRGIPWTERHASEWREAKRVADRIKERYGDLTKETSE